MTDLREPDAEDFKKLEGTIGDNSPTYNLWCFDCQEFQNDWAWHTRDHPNHRTERYVDPRFRKALLESLEKKND